jgi:flagellar hook-associated protein 3 FlgL
MRNVSLGDLGRMMQSRRSYAGLSAEVQRLTQEVTTGAKADRGRAVRGDFTALAAIDRARLTADATRLALSEAATLTGSLQTMLETAQTAAAGIAVGLMSATTTTGAGQVDALTTDARAKFFTAVSALNMQVGDRYVLSGTATDARPISGGQDILDALTAAIAGQVTVSGVTGAVAAWFDAPPGGGGYLDTVYGGSLTPLAPLQTGAGDSVSMTLTAADPAIVDLLEGLATAALVAEGALAGDVNGRALLTRAAGQMILSADGPMTGIRAALGTVEATVADAQMRRSAEVTALDLARATLIEADPYAAATALEEAQARIETLYTLTARLSRLSLAEVLR